MTRREAITTASRVKCSDPSTWGKGKAGHREMREKREREIEANLEEKMKETILRARKDYFINSYSNYLDTYQVPEHIGLARDATKIFLEELNHINRMLECPHPEPAPAATSRPGKSKPRISLHLSPAAAVLKRNTESPFKTAVRHSPTRKEMEEHRQRVRTNFLRLRAEQRRRDAEFEQRLRLRLEKAKSQHDVLLKSDKQRIG